MGNSRNNKSASTACEAVILTLCNLRKRSFQANSSFMSYTLSKHNYFALGSSPPKTANSEESQRLVLIRRQQKH